MLAIDVADRLARALVDIARDLQHLDPVREQLQELVEPRPEVERLEQRLLLLDADVDQARDEIGEPRGAFDALQRGHHLLGHLGQQLQDLGRPLLQRARASLDLRVGLLGIVDELHARRGERVAVEEFEHAEAAQAPRDRVMQAVGRRDVAKHAGAGADPVQVVGAGLLDVGLALQQHAERALGAHGLLRGGARALAPDRQREHGTREHHDVAHRQDDQRVVGERTRPPLRGRALLGRGRLAVRAAVRGKGIAGVRVLVHRASILRRRSTRQPSAISGAPIS